MLMPVDNVRQLQKLLTYCQGLDVDVEFDPRYSYFTATTAADISCTGGEDEARDIQKQIQKESSNCSKLVCYCFDPYSTLVYAIDP